MFNFLKEHALKNVWCTPDQDKQVIFKPARISRGAGLKNDIKIGWELHKLPTVDERYHVYQIGQIHPIIIGLIEEVYKWHNQTSHPTTITVNSPVAEYYSSDNIWIPFDVICKEQNMVADFYIDNGTQLPRFTTYAMVTDDRNLIIAVKDQPKIVSALYSKNFYIRLYSNAYFGSARSNNYAHDIHVSGLVITNVSDIININNEITARKLLPGNVFVYINGILHDAVTVINAAVDDIVEYYHDSTIKSVVDIPLKDLSQFESILDEKIKYLLTYPESGENDLIDYKDDIDFYLITKTFPETYPDRFKGCYYHKNQPDAVRMVTHKDYAIAVIYTMAYVEHHSFFGNSSDNVIVRLFIRNSGYDRALVDEHNRIKELYKLSDEQVTTVMSGFSAVVPEWHAANLENSWYTKIMGSKSKDITKQMVQDAYGYNAVSKLIANTPLPVIETGSVKHATLPVGLRVNSTIFELDADGFVLNWRHHLNDPDYFPIDVNCEMIDGVIGEPTNHLDMVFGETTSPILPDLTYRMYKTRIVDGLVQWDQWEDVTDSSDYYIFEGNLTWEISNVDWYTCVKSDLKTLCYDQIIDINDYLFDITIGNEETHSNVTLFKELNIPPANLDVWMNGKYLIEGLDYFINWPNLIICNKEYLIVEEIPFEVWCPGGECDPEDAPSPITEQKITIRCIGFCNDQMEIETPDEFGFVINGALSNDTAYDIRDDKVLLISIEGALRSRENLIFTENQPTVLVPDVRNGAPYVIKDAVVPMRDATVEDTTTLRALSLDVDKRVSEYLTSILGAPEPVYPNVIPRHYELFSPFCSKLIHDLKYGLLVLPGIAGHYSEMDMTEWLADYEYLLPFDPCRNNIDENYVKIHPHPLYTTIALNFYEYSLVERAIAFYLFNKVDLTQFVTMQTADIVPPTVPTDLVLSNITSTEIQLDWTASVDITTGIAAYHIYRDDVFQYTVVPNVTTFVDTGLTPNTNYQYSIIAIDGAANESEMSAAVFGMTTPP